MSAGIIATATSTGIVNQAYNFVLVWQVLIGSVIGAGSALGVLVVDRILQRKKERNDYVLKVDKFLFAALRNTLSIKDTLNEFIQAKLIGKFIPHIHEDTKNTKPSYGKAFFPLLSKIELPEDILNSSTGSNYVDMRVMDALIMSKDFAHTVSDAERQFEFTLDSNKEAALRIPMEIRQVVAGGFNENLEAQIHDYIAFLRKELIQTNVTAYVKTLAHARVAIREYYSTTGPSEWKRKFPSPTSEAQQVAIEKWLAPKVDEEVRKYLKS